LDSGQISVSELLVDLIGRLLGLVSELSVLPRDHLLVQRCCWGRVCESTTSSFSPRLSASDCMVCLDVDVVDCTTASESVYYVVIVEWRLKSSLKYSVLCLSAALCVHIAFLGCFDACLI
jgi:hypothetical protein